MNTERPAFFSGTIFTLLQFGVMLYFIILVFPQMGPPDAVAQKITFYTERGEILRWGNYLLMLPTPFFLLFLGGVGSLLRRTEASGGMLATTAVISGTLVAILWPLSGVVNNIGIDIAQAGGDAATVLALDAVGPYTLALSALPRAVLLAAMSLGLGQGQLAPRWLVWLGFVIAGLSLVGTATLVIAAMFPLLALSTLLFDGWVLALSLVQLHKARVVLSPGFS